MNVREIMSTGVRTCSPDDTLESVAKLKWDTDCGCVPVVNVYGEAVGMVTDRDICMGAYTKGLPLSKIFVSSTASRTVTTVRDSESLGAAQALMQKHRVQRLPVVDAAAKLIGVVSMADLARHAPRGPEARRT
jgi:CBS-domain-containing membrane protein